jgi:hypothetical protein
VNSYVLRKSALGTVGTALMSLYWNYSKDIASNPITSGIETFGIWFCLVALPYSFVPSVTAIFAKGMQTGLSDPYDSAEYFSHSVKPNQRANEQ